MAMAMLPSFWIFLMAVYVPGGGAQTVQMDASKWGFVGSQVELRCLFVNSNPPVKISQVTWQKFLNGTKQNVAIANPSLGVSVLPPFKERVSFKQPAVRHRTPSLEDTTITFSNLRLNDEAAYICEYTTFPAGNRENMVNLTVLARPMISMTLSAPTIVARSSNRKLTVASCLSANGKPPSTITWDTRLKGEEVNQETQNANGTVTVLSNYVLVPSRATHKQKLTCIVTYRNERITESVILNVLYEPEVTVEGFDGNWYLNRPDVRLICKADGNPPATVYQWKMLNGTMPANAEIRNDTLLFKGLVTNDVAGTYVCDATNSIGTRSGQVEVNVTEKPLPLTAPGLLGILGGIVVVGLIGVVITLLVVCRRQQKPLAGAHNDTADHPPARKQAPAPPKRRSNDAKRQPSCEEIQSPGRRYEELPNTADYVSYRLACNKEDCLEPHSPPLQSPLTYLPQQPYAQPPSNSPVFRHPPPGALASYTFPKEQYV